MIMQPNEITELRRLVGLSQATYGQLMGVTGGTVSHWESGIRTPPPIYHVVMIQLRTRVLQMPDTGSAKQALNSIIISGGVLGFLNWLYANAHTTKGVQQ